MKVRSDSCITIEDIDFLWQIYTLCYIECEEYALLSALDWQRELKYMYNLIQDNIMEIPAIQKLVLSNYELVATSHKDMRGNSGSPCELCFAPRVANKELKPLERLPSITVQFTLGE